jgi:hypothetical protein
MGLYAASLCVPAESWLSYSQIRLSYFTIITKLGNLSKSSSFSLSSSFLGILLYVDRQVTKSLHLSLYSLKSSSLIFFYVLPSFCVTSFLISYSHLDFGLLLERFSFSITSRTFFRILYSFILRTCLYYLILLSINLSSQVFIFKFSLIFVPYTVLVHFPSLLLTKLISSASLD